MALGDNLDGLFEYCPEEVREKYLNYPFLERRYQALLEGEFEYVALDLETTGFDPEIDRVIEVAAIRVRGGKIQNRMSSLINPEVPIPPLISRLTGIDDSMVKECPAFYDFFPSMRDFIDAFPVVAYSPLEKVFLERFYRDFAGKSFHNPYIDTLDLAMIFLPFLKRHRLSDLCRIWNIEKKGDHRAEWDVECLIKLFEVLVNAAYNAPVELIATLLNHCKEKSGLALLFSRVLLERSPEKRPKLFDLTKSIRPARELLGASPMIPLSDEPGIEKSEIIKFFSTDGLLANVIENYEARSEQVEMALAVREALLNDEILLVEAGTGTGKSLAYLFPSALWALSAGKPVVVSTRTLNLQDQLYTSDLPLVKRALGAYEFRFALLKGYSNYVCPRKLQSVINGKMTFEDYQVAIIGMLLNWLGDGGNGDVSLLNVSNLRGLDLYVLADYRDCSRELCDYAKKGLCPYRNAIERAKLSHIVVVNHSLLLTGAGIQFDKLIIDEAHTLEDAATEQFSIGISYSEAKRFLRFMHEPFEGSGFLAELENRIERNLDPDTLKKTLRYIAAAKNAVDNCHVHLESFFLELSGFSKVVDDTEEVRFTPSVKSQPGFAALLSAGISLISSLEDLKSAISQFKSFLSEKDGLPGDVEFALHDVEGKIVRVGEMIESFNTILFSESENFVFWAVVSNPSNLEKQSIQCSPINVGPQLKRLLYDNIETLCMTSATLTVGGSFDFFESRCGINLVDPNRVKRLMLDTSFDFEKQMEILTLIDMPPPDSPDFESMLAGVIKEVLIASEGGALVLFTNRRLMIDTYNAVAADLERKGIPLLCQLPRYSRRRLTEEFIENPRASLFGAASFWEGVDARGDTLRLVVLTRIPFESPGRAVFEARCEVVRREGKSDFMELSLPLAALRLKQGVGRLIRTKTDRGQVLILDSRIHSKQYGKILLKSLPRGNLRSISLEGLTEALVAFRQSS